MQKSKLKMEGLFPKQICVAVYLNNFHLPLSQIICENYYSYDAKWEYLKQKQKQTKRLLNA